MEEKNATGVFVRLEFHRSMHDMNLKMSAGRGL
jgi:hypothetical protein